MHILQADKIKVYMPAAFAVWLIVFFKDVHLDEEKAFGKYRLK